MCIVAFLWQAHPLYPLLLLQNRDEYHNRPTKPIDWWEECDMVGGRDELGGGTWLACSRTGRVAFLTNVLELQTLPEAKTRGELPLLFLKSKKSPMEFAEELREEVQQYNGFNLIVADISCRCMVYISNRPKCKPVAIKQVPPGIHVLSNAKLDSPWPKALRLRMKFEELLDQYGDGEIPLKEMAEKLMRDRVKADRSSLPGITASDWELNLSSIFVEVNTPLGYYGTRSIAALIVRGNGEVSFHERYLEDEEWKERFLNFWIQNAM